MSLNINYREIYRYLGYRGASPDGDMVSKIEACARRILDSAEPRALSDRLKLSFLPENGLDMGGLTVKSENLTKNLTGCEQVIFFAATLGTGVDRVISRASQRGRVSEAVICQAAAAALIEEYCDQVNEALRREFAEKGLYLRPRFSPGYGDFSISHQEDILRFLRAQERIGLTVTESMLLAPMKSVTAVIGAGRGKKAGNQEE